jgi:alkylation response protein AidB-like acyl-CoA dehydrogenase
MEFGFSSDQEMLRQSFAKFLANECSFLKLREWLKDENGFSTGLWKQLGELGWLGLVYDEKYGGSGLSFLDLFIVFEEMGATLLPSPFFTSAVLSGMLIRDAGNDSLKDEYLPSIIGGDKILTTALMGEDGDYDWHDPGIEAIEGPEGTYRIHGTRLLVPYAHVADEILLCANLKRSSSVGPTIFKINRHARALTLTPLATLTGEKRFAVSFENTAAANENIVGAPGKGDAYLRKIWPKAVVLKCGEMLGGLRRVLDMTIDYVKTRQQFGRLIGSLQIIQHYCADMATYLEATRLIAYQAASLCSQDDPCDKEIAMAKAWCNEAYKKSTWIAHQIHGAMGFTEEYDLHLFYKHAKEAELTFGDSRFHRSLVADKMGI